MVRRALLTLASVACVFGCIGCKVPVVLAGFNDLTTGILNTAIIVGVIAAATQWPAVEDFIDQMLQTLPV